MRLEQKVAKIAKGVGSSLSFLIPSRPLRASVTILLLLSSFVAADGVAPVTVKPGLTDAWVGQRVPFSIELRSTGSFAGTPNFELPEIPGALILKIGSPVISSEKIGDTDYFIQLHEFALFSQRQGKLIVPPIAVRFGEREGFTGPARDVNASTAPWQITVRRPPGTRDSEFLVTTPSLEITETWNPTPGPAKVGDIFKRTIVQRAPHLSGMALAPAPTTAPKGIRLYPPAVEVSDKSERGEFLGERSETLTYLLQKPGDLELPAISYTWWNPKTDTLQSKTLPAVPITVAAPPATAAPPASKSNALPWATAIGALVLCLIVWKWRLIVAIARNVLARMNPPERIASRKLLLACRANDARAAVTAWTAWRATRPGGFQPYPALSREILDLHRHLFGSDPASAWDGTKLASAFNATLKTKTTSPPSTAALPQLNP